MLEIVLIILVFSGTLMAGLFAAALNRRSSPMALSFAVCCLCAAIWDFGFAAEVISPSLEQKLFWANLQFLGISFLPVAWLSMTLYSTAKPRQNHRIIPVLGLIPFITNLILWTNPYHHLFRQSPTINTAGVPFPVLVGDYGPYFYAIHAPYGYILFVVSLYLLIHAWRKAPAVYRQQRLLLVLALLFPLLIDLLYVSGVSPIASFNFTSIVFSFSGLILGANILSFHFLDIVPLAYEAALNSMDAGVIVVDAHNRITHVNPAAERILGIVNDHMIGLSLISENPKLAALCKPPDAGIEIIIPQDGVERTYLVRSTVITGKSRKPAGKVITFTDISERVELHRQVENLSITDELTEALNRRALHHYGEREITAAKRYNRQLALIMLDIDNFKEINDRFGHQFGDNVLRLMVKTIRQKIRENDLVFRFGGDEFILILPETDHQDALILAERLRADLANLILEHEPSLSSGILACMGVAIMLPEDNLEALLYRADQALYLAKIHGKNRIEFK